MAATVTGSLDISGSSTVLPITQLATEAFAGENPDVSASVDGPGTGDGFVLFCEGKTDISDASRQIEDEEAAACKKAGIHYVELEIGLDGITVMTNPANDAVNCLNMGDLYSLFGPESNGFDNWSDADEPGQAGRWERTTSRTPRCPSRPRARSPGPTTRSSSSPGSRTTALAQGVPEDEAASLLDRLPVESERQRDHPGHRG